MLKDTTYEDFCDIVDEETSITEAIEETIRIVEHAQRLMLDFSDGQVVIPSLDEALAYLEFAREKSAICIGLDFHNNDDWN